MGKNEPPKIGRTLFEDFQLDGTWWLPETPNDRMPGELDFCSNTGPRLRFPEGQTFGHRYARLRQFPLMIGVDVWNTPCTLIGNENMSFPMGWDVISNHLIMGKHYVEESDIKFASMSVGFNGLEGWSGIRPFNAVEDKHGYQFVVGYSEPPPMPFRMEQHNTSVVVESRLLIDRSDFEAQVTYHAFLRLEPDQPQAFSWYLRLIKHTQRLLALMLDVPIYIKRAIAKDSESKLMVSVFAGQSNRIMGPGSFTGGVPITLVDVRDRFGEVLSEWSTHADSLETVYDLLFMTFFEPNMHHRFKYLTMIQALETFHRTVFGGRYMDESAYKPFRDQITQAIPAGLDESHREALKNRIKWGFDYSLQKRLNELFGSLDASTVAKFTNNRKTLVTRMKDTRNYLTHNDETSKEAVFDPSQYEQAAICMRRFLKVLILKRTGVPEGMLANTVTMKFPGE